MRVTFMKFTLLVVLLAAATLAPIDGPVIAAGKRDKLQAALAKDDAKARKKVLKAVEKYAKWCADHGAFAEARVYTNVKAMLAGTVFGGKEFDKLRDKEDAPDEDYAADRESERKNLTDAGADLLSFVIDAWKKGGEDFAAETAAIWLLYFRDDALLEKAQWGWCAKQGSLMPAEAIKQVEGGELRHAGEWLDAAAIDEFQKKHSTFADPFVFTDGRVTVYSELPLDYSLRLANHASRFRVFLIGRIGGELNLKLPSYPLRSYIAKDRASYNSQGKKLADAQGASWPKTYEGGKYMGMIGLKDCPIILSPDVPVSDTECIASNEMSVQELVQHELTHMVSVECLKDREKGRSDDYNLWVYEGLATWIENFYWSDEKLEFEWVLRRGYTLNKELGKRSECRLGRAVARLDDLPATANFVVQTDSEFNAAALDGYAQSCATWVYLYQSGAARRARLFEYTRMVYCKEGERDSFAKAFKGEDLNKLDGEIRAWLKGLEFVD